ncbi:hypothetical protein Y032_0046g1396 [Ancylostoma ceylanicum]|uniref:Reverse transcriptase domain-containing protein n=1 Tax=Ancylostoma ceylanicum TaxID=53326 RepID=A0A016UCR9_9BILA|nr:hypothetical protein Y032_0046g1396 [Ancylostoma ceylanicum]
MWSGNKSREIGCGFKIIYNGSPNTRNGVGVNVSERVRNSVAEVQRYCRLMKIVVATVERRIHFFSAYAPQTGCSDKAKDDFWTLLDGKTEEVPPEDTIIVARDLNGHVGATKEGYRCQRGYGYGTRNSDGERILEYADSHNLVIVNTKFRKRPSHLVSFYSGSTQTQIDFVLIRYRDQNLVTDAKVVPYEVVATQHRPLICTTKIIPAKQKQDERCGPTRVKWWRLKENEAAVVSRIQLPSVTTVNETWEKATGAIAEAARTELAQQFRYGKAWDAIHWVRLLIEKHRENQEPLHLAFLDLEKAFDRVPREVIWYALRRHAVPEEHIEWVRIVYADPRSQVKLAAGTSAEFPIIVGVHQGSALSPLLFIVVMDAITRDLQKPVAWTLLFANDIVLASEDRHKLELQTQAWSGRLAQFGLRRNVKKTEYLTTYVNENGTVKVNGTNLARTETFKYLGSTVTYDDSLSREVLVPVNSAWMKWRSVTGVLCDKNIPERFKSKVYRTVVRAVALHGAECWAVTKEVERRVSGMEMKMLR